MEMMDSNNILNENESASVHNTNSVLGAGPIAAIVVAVVALVAVVGTIGYKLTQKPTTTIVSDNAYTSM